MKLVHPEIDEIFEIDKGYVNELIVENQILFSRLIEDINEQINGMDGITILSENNTPIKWNIWGEMIYQFIPFELNKKNLLSKIYSFLEKESVNDINFMTTKSFLSSIDKYIQDITFNQQCDFYCNKITISSILKSVGLQIDSDGFSNIEKIYEYIHLVCEYDCNKVFIMVNLRSFFSDIELQYFINTILDHGHRIFLLESSERYKLNNTKRHIIDYDLCEIN